MVYNVRPIYHPSIHDSNPCILSAYAMFAGYHGVISHTMPVIAISLTQPLFGKM